MAETRPYIPWDMIQGFMTDTFVAYGVPLEDAKICTDVLLESDGVSRHVQLKAIFRAAPRQARQHLGSR